ncbi:MAG: hypothetical protein GY716_03455 [bacterium]|nr:hypothetical protein [bacterium]
MSDTSVTRGSRAWVVPYAVGVGAMLLLGLRVHLRAIDGGLDPSFIYAYNFAAERGLQWGSEFLSTYGPYGFLLMPLDIGSHAVQALLFQLVLLVAGGIVAMRFVLQYAAAAPWATAGLTVAVTYALAVQSLEWLAFGVLTLVVACALDARRDAAWFGAAGAIAGLYLLLKFSLGFGAFATLLVAAPLFAQPRRIAQRLGAGVGAAALVGACGWLTTGASLAALPEYLSTGWQISSGYSAAMSLAPPGGWIGVVGYLSFFALLGLWAARVRERKLLLVLAASAFPLFTAWKHSMVRQDGHVVFLALFGALVLVAGSIAVPSAKRRESGAIAVVALAFLLVASAGSGLVPPIEVPDLLTRPLRRLAGGEILRSLRYGDHRAELAATSRENLERLRLPDPLLAAVRGEAVDVYPGDVAYTAANDMSWRGRPLPTSFSSYTPQLDRLNAQFLAADDAPRFLLWTNGAGVYGIDGRHLFWDEPYTLQTIVDRYDVEDSADGATLLVRRESPRFGERSTIATDRAEWGEWKPAPAIDGGVLLLAVEHQAGLIERFERLAYRQAPVRVSLRFADGRERTYRVPPDHLPSGLWIMPLPTSLWELKTMLSDGMAQVVTEVRLDAGPVTRLGGAFDLRWERLEVVDRKPPPRTGGGDDVLAHADDDGTCSGAVEEASLSYYDWNSGRRLIGVAGWARDGGRAVDPRAIHFTDAEGKLLPALVQTGLHRPDVAQHYEMPGLEYAGWRALTVESEADRPIGFVVQARDGALVRSCNTLPTR